MNFRSLLSISSIALCLSNPLSAGLNIPALNAYANVQDYGPIRDIVYDAESLSYDEQRGLVTWLREKADEGHAPMMYFLVRNLYKRNFNGHDHATIVEALKYSYISLVRIYQDESCRISGPSCFVHDLFKKRYDEKFFTKVNIDSETRQDAINAMLEWFIRFDECSTLPAPYWVAFVARSWFTMHMFNYMPVDVAHVAYLFERHDTPIDNPRYKALEEYRTGRQKFIS